MLLYARRGKAVTEALGQYKFKSEYFLEWGYYWSGLGIYLDQDLDFDIQMEVLSKSLSKKIGFLKHVSLFLKRSHKVVYYCMMLSWNLLSSTVRVCGHLWARKTWTAFSDFKRGQQEWSWMHLLIQDPWTCLILSIGFQFIGSCT